MNDYIEMEVAIVEGLEDEVSCLQRQIKALADFLMANFKGDVSLEDDIFGEGAVKVAVRLLGELKERRQQAEKLDAEMVYLLFAGYDDPAGGAWDFRGAFETLEEAQKHTPLTMHLHWAHIAVLEGGMCKMLCGSGGGMWHKLDRSHYRRLEDGRWQKLEWREPDG